MCAHSNSSKPQTAANPSNNSMTNSAAPAQAPAFIEVGKDAAARRIAVRARAGSAPGLFWLSGFNSDMQGTKALALDAWAAEHNRACVRFDYSGHGESGGAFIDGTIGRWLEESVAVFEQFCAGPQVVIGSSMGGWIALLLTREVARREASRATIAGLVLVAPARPAPDVVLTVIQDGDHRLSRPQDIARMLAAVAEISAN